MVQSLGRLIGDHHSGLPLGMPGAFLPAASRRRAEGLTMPGTLSRIPRGTNLVAGQLESLGIALAEPPPATVHHDPGSFTSVMRRSGWHCSPVVIERLRATVQRGDLTLAEVRSALLGARLTSEDDIHRVLAQTIRLKRAIIALGTGVVLLMRRVDPQTAAALLRTWARSAVEERKPNGNPTETRPIQDAAVHR
jgi:hypothetical protein